MKALLSPATRAVLRTTRLAPFYATSAAGLLLAAVPWLSGMRLADLDVALLLRCCCAVTVLGAAFALDDAARPLTETLSYSWSRATVVRTATVCLLLAPVWAGQLLLAPLGSTGRPLPWAALSMEPLALTLWTCSIAALGARRPGRDSGAVQASAALLLTAGVLAILPEAWTPYATPHTRGFAPSRLWWAALAVLALLLLVRALGRRTRPLLLPMVRLSAKHSKT